MRGGAIGSALFALIEGYRGRAVAISSMRGSVVIGTVISVQMSSFSWAMTSVHLSRSELLE